MASFGNHGTAASKHLRVLLPFTRHTLRIPDELAGEIGTGVGGTGNALVVGKVKAVHRVEVGRDGDGPFLGRGWSEFADACGAGAEWLLVLRHRGRGVLTVKAFDASCCLRELTPPAATSSNGASRRPQFINLLTSDSMAKMLIPLKFVQHCIPQEHLNDRTAMVIGPLGNVCHIELEMHQSDVFFAGGWLKFLAIHDITEADSLVLRYEGSMVFTVEVFGPNRCQRGSRNKEIRTQQSDENINNGMQQEVPSAASTLADIEKQQEVPSASIQKCKRKNDESGREGQKRSKGSISLRKASTRSKCAYDVGLPAQMRKQINACAVRNYLALPASFCKAIGLPEMEPSTIMLKTSLSSTTKSWQARLVPYEGTSSHLGTGWTIFVRDNKIKEGDVCVFSAVEPKLWHVVIERQEAST